MLDEAADQMVSCENVQKIEILDLKIIVKQQFILMIISTHIFLFANYYLS